MSSAISRRRRLSKETTLRPLRPVCRLFPIRCCPLGMGGGVNARKPCEFASEADDVADNDHGGRLDRGGFFGNVAPIPRNNALLFRCAGADDRPRRLSTAPVRDQLVGDAWYMLEPHENS